ncbi:MAG: glycosyltransferase family 2 protein [Patescibacteria group bacterium UBA2103]
MKVSVVIPTYNRVDLLKKAIDSVAAQTYRDFEIIVVDDGEDSPEEMLAAFSNLSITYHKNEKKLGGGGSRNKGVSLAAHDVIAFLDDDDSWVPEKLEKQVAALREHKEALFCFCAVLNVFPDKEERTHVVEGLSDVHLLSLRRFKGFLTSGLVVYKDVFERIGGFDATFPSHQEAELMIRLSREGKGVGIDEPLVRMNLAHGRDHIGGNIERRIKGREMLLKKHEGVYKEHKDIYALQWYRLSFLYRDAKKSVVAASCLLHAWRFSLNPYYLIRCIVMLVFKR